MKPIVYPKAKWLPLTDHSGAGMLPQRDLIVLHITQGSTADGAIQTFKQSVRPNRVSAHFVIDRGGEVYQLVDINDTAWHASECNSRAIGIEHVAMAQDKGKPGMPATDAQYTASAALVSWLCTKMSIACDRLHIRTHNEASPQDGHVLCCTGALNPDKLVEMAAAL